MDSVKKIEGAMQYFRQAQLRLFIATIIVIATTILVTVNIEIGHMTITAIVIIELAITIFVYACLTILTMRNISNIVKEDDYQRKTM